MIQAALFTVMRSYNGYWLHVLTETNPGSTDALCDYWIKNYVKTLHLPVFVSIISTSKKSFMTLITCRSTRMYRNPRVGVVGEIYVKFHPSANNHINELIEKEGGRSRYIWLTRLLLVIAQWIAHIVLNTLMNFYGYLASSVHWLIEALELYRLPYAKP